MIPWIAAWSCVALAAVAAAVWWVMRLRADELGRLESAHTNLLARADRERAFLVDELRALQRRTADLEHLVRSYQAEALRQPPPPAPAPGPADDPPWPRVVQEFLDGFDDPADRAEFGEICRARLAADPGADPAAIVADLIGSR